MGRSQTLTIRQSKHALILSSLLSRDVEAKVYGSISFLTTQYGFIASLDHIFLTGCLFFRAKFVVLPVHRPDKSSVNVGLTDNVEVMAKRKSINNERSNITQSVWKMVDLAPTIASKQVVNSDFRIQISIKASAIPPLLYTQPESGTLPVSSWLKRKYGWNSKSVAQSSTSRLSEQIATCIVLVVLRVR